MGALPALVVRLIGTLHGKVSRAAGRRSISDALPPVKAAIIGLFRSRPQPSTRRPGDKNRRSRRPGFPSQLAEPGSRKAARHAPPRRLGSTFAAKHPPSCRCTASSRARPHATGIAPFTFRNAGAESDRMLSNNSLFCSSTRISALLVEVPPQPPLWKFLDSTDVSRPWGARARATSRLGTGALAPCLPSALYVAFVHRNFGLRSLNTMRESRWKTCLSTAVDRPVDSDGSEADSRPAIRSLGRVRR